MNSGLTHSACIRGGAFRHCFISFPHHWRAFIAPASIPTFKIESASQSLIVSWAGHTHDHMAEGEEEEAVYVSLKLLEANEFSDGEIIIIRQVPCPSPCTSTSMSILTVTDWEELLLNVEAAQEALLTQFRVVKKGQIAPLWLDGGAFIFLKIHKLSTLSDFGLLQLNTEVHILPPSQSHSLHPLSVTPSSKNSETNVVSNVKSKACMLNTLYTIFTLLGYGNKKIGVLPKQEVFLGLKVVAYSPPAVPVQQNVFFKVLMYHPSVVFISKAYLKNTKYDSSPYFISKISKVNKNESEEALPLPSLQDSTKTVFTVVVVWEAMKEIIKDDSSLITEIDLMLKHKRCVASVSLKKKLSLDKKSIILLKTEDSVIEGKFWQVDVNVISKFTKENSLVSETLTSLLNDLCNTYPIIINDSTIMSLNIDDKSVYVSVSTRDGNPLLLEKTCIHRLSVNVESGSNHCPIDNCEPPEHERHSINQFDPFKVGANGKTLEDLLDFVKQDLNFEIQYSTLCPQFILLQGAKGSGKTALGETLCKRMSQRPFFVNCEIIHLKLLKGKKVDSVEKLLNTSFKDALDYQPSVIVLDDLDFLAPSHSGVEEEKGSAFEHVRCMAFMMKCLLVELLDDLKRQRRSPSSLKHTYVTVVATCCSRDDIHSLLSAPKGTHIFPRSLHVTPPDSETKFNIVQSSLELMRETFLKKSNILRCKETSNEAYFLQFSKDKMLLKLEVLTLLDINTLALRIFLEAKRRWKHDYKIEIDNHFIETDEHFKDLFSFVDEDATNALNGFVSLSSKAVSSRSCSKTMRKIGGLAAARGALEEMILWPSQYPQIFSQTKLRLRSGILLYGPPGCGKTLLANSFKNYSHLNFITIKGPELLSKYIGQSEKSVRDAFKRAESAKPCVLFFDEFESVAPRRGHDNTGVTDRVVNQLLTQMDGVEGLSEVYVVAATSRPDLIDPALLRPGRLDKGIYCPMPNEGEREDILTLLSEELTFQDFVDFNEIAKKTDGFTGADLQGLLSTAQMKAAEQAIGKALYENAFEDHGNDRDFEEIVEMTMNKDNGIETSILHDPNVTKDSTKKVDLFISITNTHLHEALSEVRPSVSVEERMKHQDLHKKFSSQNENKVFTLVKPGKRETLA